MTAWIHIIGIGEDGWEGLAGDARTALEQADVIIGGARHHGLAPDLKAERIQWPSPFRSLVDEIGQMAGQQVAVLVTGDPLWFSAGAYIANQFGGQTVVYPQLSSFQLAAARLGWSLADVETLTVHGRPAEQIIPYFSNGARLLVLTQDATTPSTVAQLLNDRGFGPSQITVLGALGGANESRLDGIAQTWKANAPEFHILAITCIAEPDANQLPLTGLPDEAFEHDGQLTKREVRSMTLAGLAPRRGNILWDIGAGCGSIGIEFMRAARDAMAFAIEKDQARIALIEANKIALGTPRLKIIHAKVPDSLTDLPSPDAIFIGGGLTRDLANTAREALNPKGRLVINAVTLESEALLNDFHDAYGGSLSRISVSRAVPVGRLRGWKPFMPVTQWIWTK